jgi:bromodomain-containing factor 1
VRSDLPPHRQPALNGSQTGSSSQFPDYPKIVKKPMDLTTMRGKLESGAYPTAEKFRDDFKLTISNCNLYNPPGTPVHQAGAELKKLFEEKWKGLPPLRAESEDEEGEDDSESDDGRARARMSFAMLCCVLLMRSTSHHRRHGVSNRDYAQQHQCTETLRRRRSRRSQRKRTLPPRLRRRPPRHAKKEAKGTYEERRRRRRRPRFLMTTSCPSSRRKTLSEAIQTLDGQKLERVIQIIHEGVPEIRDVRSPSPSGRSLAPDPS